MTGNMKSSERFHCKIQVCLQNLALRKLKKSIAENHVSYIETVNIQDQANSNLKPLNFESSSTEFSTSKERVDLLQDFQSHELRHDVRNSSKKPQQAAEKHINIKENDHVTETGMANNTNLSRKVQLSLPILQMDPLENMSLAKLSCPKLNIKDNVNVENNRDDDITINEINREISKTVTLDTVSFDDNKNKKDGQEKEIRENVKLVLQDVLKVGQTASDNQIMTRKQLMDSRNYLETGSQVKKSIEHQIRNSERPCLKIIDKPTQSVLKRANEKYSTFDALMPNKNCVAICLESMARNENNIQNKQIPAERRKHLHGNRYIKKNLTDKHKFTSSYLTLYNDENIKDNSLYRCFHHYYDKNMINDLHHQLQYCCKGMLGSPRNEYRRHICKVRGNSSISCGCKCKVTPSSQRVTFCLPSKKETT